MSSWMREAGGLLLAVAICQGVGALAGWVTAGPVETWYPALDKPFFTPPNWLFAPAWITLYTLMGIAAYLVARKGWRRPAVRGALAVFGGQLVLNGAWSFVFFGAQSPGGGLVVIAALLGAIIWTMVRFFPLQRWAGWLLVPYLLWVSYATALNAAIWWLN